MPARKPKNLEPGAAASNLADAAQQVHQAVSKKVDDIGAAVLVELDKTRQVTSTKRGRVKRQLDALLKRAEGRIKKATSKARKSLDKALRKSAKKLKTARAAARTQPNDPQVAGGGNTAVKTTVAKKAPTTKVPAKRAAARKVAAEKAAITAPVAKKATAQESGV
jgi:hypothetical protein